MKIYAPCPILLLLLLEDDSNIFHTYRKSEFVKTSKIFFFFSYKYRSDNTAIKKALRETKRLMWNKMQVLMSSMFNNICYASFLEYLLFLNWLQEVSVL
jgi:hypothetical protein